MTNDFDGIAHLDAGGLIHAVERQKFRGLHVELAGNAPQGFAVLHAVVFRRHGAAGIFGGSLFHGAGTGGRGGHGRAAQNAVHEAAG